MRYTICTEHVRQHTLTDQQVKCFNTSVGMTDGYIAKTGDWITYAENENGYRTGRMLGRVDAPAVPDDKYPCEQIKGYLSILALSDDCTYCYVRWVKPEDVRGIRKQPPAAFLVWFTGPLPSAPIVHHLSAYGTLSDRYIDKVEERTRAFERDHMATS